MAKSRPKTNQRYAGKIKRWQVQEAKARFSEVVDIAGREGPQTVTRRGKVCAYVVSPEHFQRMQPPAKRLKLSELFRPLAGLKIERAKDYPRPGPDFSEQLPMPYLLDTCAVCEASSTQPNFRVVDWIDALSAEETFLSCITIGEIQKGIALLPAGRKRRHLEGWLQGTILPQFAGRIVAVEAATALRWGSLLADLERRGLKMPLTDSLIAAIALTHDLTLVTRNEFDFARCGVRVSNPWK